MTEGFEKIDNLVLLDNGIEHIRIELNKNVPLFFRIGKEAHLVLYRSMVEALRGTANRSITGSSKDRKRIVKYKIGEQLWKQIEKADYSGCKHAWRYSDPIQTAKPDDTGERFDISDMSNYLQSFYDLLAKIQAECFMSRNFNSKPIQVSDKEMQVLEWLHEEIRNEFEHFIPKLYYVPIPDLLSASRVCLNLSFKLLFESQNVAFYADSTNIRNALEDNMNLLKQRQAQYILSEI